MYSKEEIKKKLFNLSPTIFGGLFAIRSRRVAQEVERRENLNELSDNLVERYGRKVKNGPFKGIVLPKALTERHIGPFLFGSHESCLHGIIKKLCTKEYKKVIDIGSSFGYYAVGFATKLKKAQVHAFDTDPWARKQVKKMARQNGTENITISVACTPDRLKNFSTSQNLILSDCEGYESELFNVDVINCLSGSDVIIEIHPAGSAQTLNSIKSRFKKTHSVSVIETESAEEKKKFLPEGAPMKAIQEWRSPKQQWLVCLAEGRPRTGDKTW